MPQSLAQRERSANDLRQPAAWIPAGGERLVESAARKRRWAEAGSISDPGSISILTVSPPRFWVVLRGRPQGVTILSDMHRLALNRLSLPVSPSWVAGDLLEHEARRSDYAVSQVRVILPRWGR